MSYSELFWKCWLFCYGSLLDKFLKNASNKVKFWAKHLFWLVSCIICKDFFNTITSKNVNRKKKNWLYFMFREMQNDTDDTNKQIIIAEFLTLILSVGEPLPIACFGKISVLLNFLIENQWC